MSGYVDVIKKDNRIRVESIRDDIALRRNKEFFWPTGTQVYVGRQGSGKTISAVKHILDLKKRYPKAIIVSNVSLTRLRAQRFSTEAELRLICEEISPEEEFISFSSMDELALVLTKVNNGFRGVVYLIDEIHTYFNALESKNIPMFVFTEISQQRKQRKLIIGTSQLFLRMAKPLREQCDNLIMCRTFLGALTIQKAYDGMTLTQEYDGSLSGNHKKTGWFWHSRYLRKSFDTYQKVVSGEVQFEESQREIKIVGKKGKALKIS